MVVRAVVDFACGQPSTCIDSGAVRGHPGSNTAVSTCNSGVLGSPHYSITASARAISVSGTSRPSALAVLRL
jgi:hypothetical protein